MAPRTAVAASKPLGRRLVAPRSAQRASATLRRTGCVHAVSWRAHRVLLLTTAAHAPRHGSADPLSLKAAAQSRVDVPARRRGVTTRAAAMEAAPSSLAASVKPWAHFLAALGAFVLTDKLLLMAAAANGALRAPHRTARAQYCVRCQHARAPCLAGVTFPPPLLGMFAIIASLIAFEARFGTTAVEKLMAAVAPGIDWIGRWLPLFYVPSLVTLPLALQALPGALLAKTFALLLCGWVASLLFAAFITVRIRAVTNVELLPVPPAAKAAGFSLAHRAGWAVALCASLLALAVAPASLQHLAVGAFMLSATIVGFLAGSATPAGVQKVLHPLIACALFANAAAALAGAMTGAGWEGVLRAYLTKGKAGAALGAGDWLMAFLHSVILSFGFRVFAQRALMKRHFAEIGGCVLASSAFGMAFSAVAGAALALPPQLSMALAPRSVTVALALPIASMLGASAEASITAAAVMFTGLLGANFAQPLLTAAGYRDPVVRGLATAASAHGLGTAALAAKEPEALPMAALAYATMGVVSSLLASVAPFRAALYWLALC